LFPKAYKLFINGWQKWLYWDRAKFYSGSYKTAEVGQKHPL